MKIISGLLGVLMLTLLALPSHATETQMAVVSRDLLSSVRNLDSLDAIIGSNKNSINFYLKDISNNNDGNLRLGSNQALIISGGVGTIAKDLDDYQNRNIWNSSLVMTYRVAAYGCYKNSRIGKATTYIMVVGDSGGWNTGWCSGKLTQLLPDSSGVKVSTLRTKVENIRNN
jgi:hypothetical protein